MTLYHATKAPKGTKIKAQQPPATRSGQQPKAVYLADTRENAGRYRGRVVQFDVDVTGFVKIDNAIKKGRKAGKTFTAAKIDAMEAAIAKNAPGVIFSGNSLNPMEVAVFDEKRIKQKD